MAKKFDKEVLFENYFQTADEVLSTFEKVFSINGVWHQFFGVETFGNYAFASSEAEQAAKDHIRTSGAWQALSDLFDYAVDGIAGSNDPTDIVIGGAEVLSYLNTENCSPAEEWNFVTALGDGRFALDDGQDIIISKLALLADVDVRTVRNAASAGELVAYKTDAGLIIENASARSWLQGRRGFKPTVIHSEPIAELEAISTPTEFGAFLSAQRKKLGLPGEESKLIPFHPGIDARAIVEIEAGVFKLPIDTVFPLADFYQLDRKAFLSSIMRVFFGEQLTMLREAHIAG